jgi:hypothetical protein
MKKNLTSSLLCCLVTLSVSTSAFSYGGEGHRAVGLLAQQRLNQRAKDAINIILNGDEQQCKHLGCVATWPDDLKLAVRNHIGPLANSKEAFAFQKSFPDNDKGPTYVTMSFNPSEPRVEGLTSQMGRITRCLRPGGGPPKSC